mmetsp:Transcript_54683/g.146042  ORF Transcript_54683/g.146042 Transcript_54683/m.146042 type:complete len:204 (+) Transcript_54683:152-763(+)
MTVRCAVAGDFLAERSLHFCDCLQWPLLKPPATTAPLGIAAVPRCADSSTRVPVCGSQHELERVLVEASGEGTCSSRKWMYRHAGRSGHQMPLLQRLKYFRETWEHRRFAPSASPVWVNAAQKIHQNECPKVVTALAFVPLLLRCNCGPWSMEENGRSPHTEHLLVHVSWCPPDGGKTAPMGASHVLTVLQSLQDSPWTAPHG